MRSFAFISFDRISGVALGYGKRAYDSLKVEGCIQQLSSVEIVFAGALGREIWTKHLPLEYARQLLAEENHKKV